MALTYNPARALELQFSIGGDAVARCTVRGAEGEREVAIDAAAGEPVVARPGQPALTRLAAPLPNALRIDVSVEGRADTDFLFIAELRQPPRLARFDTAFGRVERGASVTRTLMAAATPWADAEGESEGIARRVRYQREPLQRLPEPEPAEEEGADYMVWFGTNRKPILWEGTLIDFGPERDDRLHLGQCRVTIPRSHEIGSVGSSWWQRLLKRTDDRIAVAAVHALEQDIYWAALARSLSEVPADERHGVVFIHGFNTTFKSAAIRAAQLGFDLKIAGAMAFYSWPSRGHLLAYVADEASIEASEGFIADYLIAFATRSGAEKVHVIAHSMGNRAVLRAVDKIAARAAAGSGTPFSQLVIAAPDIDRQVFERLSGAYARLAERATMYVCAKDKALKRSGWLHSYDRAGLMPPVVVVPGVDTISVSDLDLTFFGHGYIQEAKELLADVHELIRHGTPPDKRFRLHQKTVPSGVFWSMVR